MDDYHWLVSSDAEPWLAWLAESNESLVTQTTRLRKELSPERTHLLIEQVALRRRARDKFARAGEMFFAQVPLEQATDEIVARYKATRFTPGPVYDFCCGIGGDLLALAGRGPAIGVERAPALAILAEANCRALELTTAEVLVADIRDVMLDGNAAWHMDPDRRAGGQRTTRVIDHEPGADAIDHLLNSAPNGAVKLAPAAEWPDAWNDRAEFEWISRAGECRQLVTWFGALAQEPGRRRATVLSGTPGLLGATVGLSNSAAVRTIIGDRDAVPADIPISAAGPGRYVFEPDAAVLAAHLTETLAAEHELQTLAAGCAYLTGDTGVSDAALSAFEVLDVLPYDVRRVRELLRQRGIGRLEVKKRGVPHDPEQVRREMRLTGDQPGTLLLTRMASGVTAIVARRV